MFSAAFDDNKVLASGSTDCTIKLWDTAADDLLRTLVGHGGGVNSVAFGNKNNVFVSRSADRTIKLWDTNTWDLLRTLLRTGHDSYVSSVVFNSNNILVSGSGDEYNSLFFISSLPLISLRVVSKFSPFFEIYYIYK